MHDTHPQDDAQTAPSTSEYWLEHIRKWQESGLSKAEYCRQNDLTKHLFYYRCQRLRPASPDEGTVVPLSFQVGDISPNQPCLVITVGGRYQVAIEGDFHPPVLQKLIKTLEAIP